MHRILRVGCCLYWGYFILRKSATQHVSFFKLTILKGLLLSLKLLLKMHLLALCLEPDPGTYPKILKMHQGTCAQPYFNQQSISNISLAMDFWYLIVMYCVFTIIGFPWISLFKIKRLHVLPRRLTNCAYTPNFRQIGWKM